MGSIITGLALVSTLGISGAWIYGMDMVGRVQQSRIETLDRYCHEGIDEACELLDAELDKLGYTTTPL